MPVLDKPRCLLTPIDLHDPDQAALLLRQRVACGWTAAPADVARWRAMADAGTKRLYWILRTTPSLAAPAGAGPNTDYRGAVGHIGLQSVDGDDGQADEQEDDDLPTARRDKSVLNLTTFFIEPDHRGGGLGRAAVRQAEALARVPPFGSPACHTLTVHTTSRRYTEDDGPAWRGSFAARGLELPARGSSTEDWYARMGYTKYKEAPRYRDVLLDGTEIKLVAVYMRKTLGVAEHPGEGKGKQVF